VQAALQETWVLADGFVAGVSRHTLEGGIDVDDAGLGVGDHDRLGHLLDGCNEAGALYDFARRRCNIGLRGAGRGA
jgi:hypothetical protein